jgi:Protein kinase domain
MHAANFLHRDIAPDNIIIRTDGTPVLLDFGAARRAVAEMSRSLTGIVKAGYSPHEQYTSDGRLQGPWSDLYAFGGTLYRAVTGKAPEEATLRFDEDRMAPAAQSAKGKYRRDFLGAIDTCLKVRHSERPRTVAQLRPMLLGAKSQPKGTVRLIEPTYKLPREDAASAGASTLRQVGRRWPAIAAAVAVVAGAYGGFEYRRWSTSEPERSGATGALSTTTAETQRKAAAEAQRQAALEAERLKKQKEEAEARQRHAALEAERRQKEQEAADARQRQIEIEEARRRKEIADAEEARRKAEAAAEAKRKEELRIAALEEEKRRIAAAEEARRKEQAAAEAEARRKAEAAAVETKHKEELRIAALEDERRRKEQADVEARRKAEAATAEAKRKEELRIAALEDERRRKDQAEVEARRKAEAAAEAKRKEQAEAEEKRRLAALEDGRRKEQAAAEEKLREERRIAALEETRRAEERRKEDERLRLATLPDDEARADFVRKVQTVLKRSRCWDGDVSGRSDDAQDGLDKLVDTAKKQGKAKPTRIELAKATVGDFETWLKDADTLKGGLCAPAPKPVEKPVAKPAEKPVAKAVEKPAPARPRPPPERQYSAPRPSYPSGGGGGGGGNAPIQGIR